MPTADVSLCAGPRIAPSARFARIGAHHVRIKRSSVNNYTRTKAHLSNKINLYFQKLECWHRIDGSPDIFCASLPEHKLIILIWLSIPSCNFLISSKLVWYLGQLWVYPILHAPLDIKPWITLFVCFEEKFINPRQIYACESLKCSRAGCNYLQRLYFERERIISKGLHTSNKVSATKACFLFGK